MRAVLAIAALCVAASPAISAVARPGPIVSPDANRAPALIGNTPWICDVASGRLTGRLHVPSGAVSFSFEPESRCAGAGFAPAVSAQVSPVQPARGHQ